MTFAICDDFIKHIPSFPQVQLRSDLRCEVAKSRLCDGRRWDLARAIKKQLPRRLGFKPSCSALRLNCLSSEFRFMCCREILGSKKIEDSPFLCLAVSSLPSCFVLFAQLPEIGTTWQSLWVCFSS